MVLCVMEDLVLDEGVEVQHVTFEISKHQSFKEVELTTANKECKGLYIFNHVLDPNVKWYARARALLSTGMTVWGNVDKFESTVDTDSIQSLDMPSRISVPQITTNSPQDRHDVTLFTIMADGFRIIGNASLHAVSWIIEDMYGKVVWCLLKSTIYKEKIEIGNVILKSNSVYRIKVIFHSTSNDVSPVGSYTITTMDNDAIRITSFIDTVDNREPLDIEIEGIEDVKKVAWEIVSMVGNVSTTIWKTITDGTSPSLFKTQVPALTLSEAEIYMLKVTTDRAQDGSKFLSFNTLAHSADIVNKQEQELEGNRLTEYEQFRLDSFKNNQLFLTSEEYKKLKELQDAGGGILDLQTISLQDLLDYAPIEFWLDRYCENLNTPWNGSKWPSTIAYATISSHRYYKYCPKCLFNHGDDHNIMKATAVNRAKEYFSMYNHIFRDPNPSLRSATCPEVSRTWSLCADQQRYLIVHIYNTNTQQNPNLNEPGLAITSMLDNPVDYQCPHTATWQHCYSNRQNYARGYDFDFALNINFPINPTIYRSYRRMTTKQPRKLDTTNPDHVAMLHEARDYMNKTR